MVVDGDYVYVQYGHMIDKKETFGARACWGCVRAGEV